MIGKFNIRRTLIIVMVVLVSASIGVYIGHKLTISTSGKTLSKVTPTLDKAIEKHTIKNEIKNEIKIGKVKKSDSLTVIFDPTNNQKPVNVIQQDCGDGSICIPIENLTRRQKKRLGIKF